MVDSAAHCHANAASWIEWARTPGLDAYWSYRDALRAYLPPPGRATLDLGCGEGRVSRDLTALGHSVTAVDGSAPLLAAAEAERSAQRYVHADAAALPFADDEFDVVVAYNVLMDVPDVPAVVAEVARVLAPDGVLVVSVVHPCFDRGDFAGPEDDAPFVSSGHYLRRERFEVTAEQDGRTMRFAGWAQPLQNHVGAVTSAGLVVTDLREPVPAPGSDALARRARVPLFLWLTARHGGPAIGGR